jgi:hypothetical protein
MKNKKEWNGKEKGTNKGWPLWFLSVFYALNLKKFKNPPKVENSSKNQKILKNPNYSSAAEEAQFSNFFP